jgi:(R,R)-butanediol dehydrogenase/meso-butanediol dehydrogenase/diacetyl reductase
MNGRIVLGSIIGPTFITLINKEVISMKAAMYYSARDIRIEDVPEPTPGPGQVKIQVKWCGICGTDLHEYQHGPIQTHAGPELHPLTGEKLPFPMGHEFSGVITEIGPDCKGDFKVGDNVTADPCIICGECEPCKMGKYNSCLDLAFTGLGGSGAFAEYLLVNDYQVYKMPEGMSFEDAAITEPACVALHAVRRAGISLGETVAVVGLGPIGLLCVMCAKAAGAAHIYGVENQPKRIEGALANGCDEVFDFTKCDPVEEIKKATGGKGVHVAIDANGNEATFMTCVDCVRHTGTVISPGQAGHTASLNIFPQVNWPELNILGSHVYAYEFDRVLPLIADGRISSEPIITKRVALDDIVDGGFEELDKNSAEHMKIIVTPDASLI